MACVYEHMRFALHATVCSSRHHQLMHHGCMCLATPFITSCASRMHVPCSTLHHQLIITDACAAQLSSPVFQPNPKRVGDNKSNTQYAPQYIVAVEPLSARAILGFRKVVCKGFIISTGCTNQPPPALGCVQSAHWKLYNVADTSGNDDKR